MNTSVTLPWLNLVIAIWIQTRKLWRKQSLNGRVQSSQVTTKSSATHRFNVLRKKEVSPQNLDKEEIAGTLSNQVSLHFAEREACYTLARTAKGIYEHQKFLKVKEDIWGGGLELIQWSNIRTEQCDWALASVYQVLTSKGPGGQSTILSIILL